VEWLDGPDEWFAECDWLPEDWLPEDWLPEEDLPELPECVAGAGDECCAGAADLLSCLLSCCALPSDLCLSTTAKAEAAARRRKKARRLGRWPEFSCCMATPVPAFSGDF
jgi:hypothetical protein